MYLGNRLRCLEVTAHVPNIGTRIARTLVSPARRLRYAFLDQSDTLDTHVTTSSPMADWERTNCYLIDPHVAGTVELLTRSLSPQAYCTQAAKARTSHVCLITIGPFRRCQS